MNKSIIKHEIRGMKWILVLSISASIILTMIFSAYLNEGYERMFSNGITWNTALIQNAFRQLNTMILIGFSLISIVQVFMQFRSEKSQETGRFLKSLPVKKEDFFKIKLASGIISLTLAFIVLAIGLAIVRYNNMFWIRDVHSISTISAPFIRLDGAGNLLKELGLIYLVILSFYTFLFMIQYTFTNIVGGIVTGILVWLAPIFITLSSIFTVGKLTSISFYNSSLLNKIDSMTKWLLPHIYPVDYSYEGVYRAYNISIDHNISIGNISIIADLNLKYIIVIVLILVNIGLAYRFNKASKVENENKTIVFKSTQIIFKIGVTICSGLLVSMITSEIINLQINNIVYLTLILLGGLIGYLVSHKITKTENV